MLSYKAEIQFFTFAFESVLYLLFKYRLRMLLINTFSKSYMIKRFLLLKTYSKVKIFLIYR